MSPDFLRGLLHHQAEERELVGHLERGRVVEVELVLAVAAFAVEAEQPEARLGQVARHRLEERHRVHDRLDVVRLRGLQLRAARHGFEVAVGAFEGLRLEHVQLGLHAEVEHVTELGGFVELLLQDRARAVREGFTAAEAQVGGHPHEARVPRHDPQRREIGDGNALVLVRRHLAEIAHAARRVALGAGEHVGEMVDGNDLRLRPAHDVHEAADREAHAVGGELRRQLDVCGIDRLHGVHECVLLISADGRNAGRARVLGPRRVGVSRRVRARPDPRSRRPTGRGETGRARGLLRRAGP